MFSINAVFAQSASSALHLESRGPFVLRAWDIEPVGQPGENESFSRPFSLTDFHQLNKGRYRLTRTLHIEGDSLSAADWALVVENLPSAYRIVWDGELLGTNGWVAARANEEQSGKFRCSFPLYRQQQCPGEHVLEIEFSNHRLRASSYRTLVFLGHRESVAEFYQRRIAGQAIFIGLYFAVSVLCLFLYWGGWRQPAFLCMGMYAFTYVLSISWVLLGYLNALSLESISRVEPWLVHDNTAAILCFVFFVVFFYEADKKRLVMGLFLIWTAFSYGLAPLLKFTDPSVALYTLLFTFVMVFVVHQNQKRIRGGNLVLYSVLANWLFGVVIVLLPLFHLRTFPVFLANLTANTLFMTLNILAIGLKIVHQNRMLSQVTLQAQRLENDLLKKSIQPHFILNSLLSLKSWIGKDAAVARELVELLSDEFELINRIAAMSLIPLSDEIKLCEYHLGIMGHRRQARYRLTTRHLPRHAHVPPMLFHTLIENGLTHAFAPQEDGTFVIEYESVRGWHVYTVSNNGSLIGRLPEQPDQDIEEGLGIRYVKSRLSERYGSQWKLDYGLDAGLWKVRLQFRQRGRQ